LPPSSFLISDPLIVGLAVYGLAGLVRGTVPRRTPIVLAATGLLVPSLLMLIAIYFAFRYRMEFYPVLELCAFVGFWRLLTRESRRIEIVIVFGAAAAASIVAAYVLWKLNALSPMGPATRFLSHRSIFDFYRSPLH
jgi:hypothetical protein